MNCLHPFPDSPLKVKIFADSQQMFSLVCKLILRNILCNIDLHNTTRGWAMKAAQILNCFYGNNSKYSSIVLRQCCHPLEYQLSSMTETINMLALNHSIPIASQEHPYASFCILKIITTMELPFAIIDDAF